MKKYLAAFMALAMAATALTGCGGGDSAGGHHCLMPAGPPVSQYAASDRPPCLQAEEAMDRLHLRPGRSQLDDTGNHP